MNEPDVLASATLGPVQLRNRIIKAATYEARSGSMRTVRSTHSR